MKKDENIKKVIGNSTKYCAEVNIYLKKLADTSLSHDQVFYLYISLYIVCFIPLIFSIMLFVSSGLHKTYYKQLIVLPIIKYVYIPKTWLMMYITLLHLCEYKILKTKIKRNPRIKFKFRVRILLRTTFNFEVDIYGVIFFRTEY